MKVQKIPTVQEFVAAIKRGEDAIREAADMLCAMVDADPQAINKIYKETGIDWRVLSNLEKVGRGAMHYRLLFDSSPSAKFIAMLPASQQAEVYERGVKVVSDVGGKVVVETKKPHELTPQQSRVLFDNLNHHVRTVDEQIKVRASAVRVAPAKSAQRYAIEGDMLTVFAKTTFTMSQLEDILERMKAKAIKGFGKK